MYPKYRGVLTFYSGYGLTCTFSNSIEVSIPRELCRRWRLWKVLRYSNIALASSILAFHRFLFRSSVCILPQNDSTTALMLTEQPWPYRPPFWKGGWCAAR